MDTEVISEQEWDRVRQYFRLSLLQTEIMRRLCEGRSRQQIAREMTIRPRTVRTTAERLYRQFGVSDRVQLVLHVLVAVRHLWEWEENSLYTWER